LSSAHRRKGYASAALAAITVLASNVCAPHAATQRLYREFGLEVVGMHVNLSLSGAHAA